MKKISVDKCAGEGCICHVAQRRNRTYENLSIMEMAISDIQYFGGLPFPRFGSSSVEALLTQRQQAIDYRRRWLSG